jgi:ankyrin repeat protein
MIRCQCKVNVRNDKGFTPLHLAASTGAIDVCECLLAGGADENSINVQCRVSDTSGHSQNGGGGGGYHPTSNTQIPIHHSESIKSVNSKARLNR